MWRTILLEIMDEPYGLDFGELGAVPKESVLATDETFLECCPKIQGTFHDINSKSVFISYNDDKSQATANPVSNMAGEMVGGKRSSIAEISASRLFFFV